MALREKHPLVAKRLAKAQPFQLKRLENVKQVYAEPKLDGLRGIIILANGKATAYTSNGLEVRNAEHICKAILKKLEGKLFVFDGEYFAENWNLTNSLVMTQSVHPEAKKLVFNAFDVLPYKQWEKGEITSPLQMRKRVLKELHEVINNDCFRIVKHKVIAVDKIDAFCKRAMQEGYEGGMLKIPSAPYAYKRSYDWMKVKSVQDVDCKIVGVKEGNGKYAGLVGSLECMFDHEGKQVTFNSSGMEDALRKELTALHKKNKLVGKIVEVRHEGITVNDKVRFPRFQRMRPDKD